MKRSEMIKIIDKAVRHCYLKKKDFEDDGEYILKQIEKHMTPPEYEVNYSRCDDYGGSYTEKGWEPEE